MFHHIETLVTSLLTSTHPLYQTTCVGSLAPDVSMLGLALGVLLQQFLLRLPKVHV